MTFHMPFGSKAVVKLSHFTRRAVGRLAEVWVPRRPLQYGALPFRVEPDGSTRFMLITTRGSRRWMIPKGWPIGGLQAHESAAREALEEAGLIGQTGEVSIGSFEVRKRLRGKKRVPCEIHVFPLRVERQRGSWREKHQRSTRWFTADEAKAAVSSEGLAAIIERFDARLSMKMQARIPA